MESSINENGNDLTHSFFITILMPYFTLLTFNIDYKYYYVDKDVHCPEVMRFYKPPKDVCIISYSNQTYERMIFPHIGPYTQQEETDYDNFLKAIEDLDDILPPEMTKRRVMRFLSANCFNYVKTYDNIKQHLKWRKQRLPIILSDQMKSLLDSGFSYIHGRDRNFRPLWYINATVFSQVEYDIEEIFNV